jgi:RNA polymerase sigma-70 factor (sigma-E family)
VRRGFRRSVRKIDATAGDPQAPASRPIHMNRPTADAAPAPVPVHWDADRALTAIYSDHYRCLVRLALLLVQDVTTAQDVVQDSFVAMHTAWRRQWDSDQALAYLRQSVVKRSRSAPRHGAAIERNACQPGPGMPSAEPGALPPSLEHAAVVGALRSLPARQREALVLRCYSDLSEAQIASAMGMGEGAVKRHLATAVAALRAALEMDP